MPRSSTSRSSPSRLPSYTPIKRYTPTSTSTSTAQGNLPPVSPSTTAHTLKDSLVSGVGSGIGFGIGSRIVSGLFGAPVVAVEKVGASIAEPSSALKTFSQTTVPNLQQCYQHALDASEKPLCYALLSNEPRLHEFKQCMESSENQIHMCKEFLPSN